MIDPAAILPELIAQLVKARRFIAAVDREFPKPISVCVPPELEFDIVALDAALRKAGVEP